MQEAKRVYITGLGTLTSTGNNLDETWNAILTGTHALQEIEQWDISTWPNRLGGEFKHNQLAGLLPDRKLMKVISKHDVFGIHAALQAIEHSQLLEYRDQLADPSTFNDATGIFVGSPGNKYFQQYDFLPLLAKSNTDMGQFATDLSSEVHPMWLLRILPNNVLAYVGITYGFKGANHNITNHAVGGMQALIEAFYAIQSGQIERAIVVGYDLGTEPHALFYYDKLGLISGQHLKPFDNAHDGTILADGAAAIVLESEASAQARAAVCFSEVICGNSSTEAMGIFAIENDGQHLSQMLGTLLTTQNINPQNIGLIVSHGNGNPKSDLSEAAAIASICQNEPVPVTAFKWSMGHTLCASGVLDSVLATYALHTECLPGIANLTQAAKGCETLNICNHHRTLDASKPYALVLNRGFASINACVILKSCA